LSHIEQRVVDADDLKGFCVSVLKRLRVPNDEAEITADILVAADLRGLESHGVSRLPRYVKRLMNGWVRPDAKLTIKRETPVTLHLNAENSIGQVAAYKAMEQCIRKAKKSGIAFAAITNSNHFGIAGYYAMMALRNDMIGLAMSNAWPLVVPTFGAAPILGTNPIAVAVPADEHPFVLDMSTSVVPIGKMEVYQRHNRPVPVGWAIDEKGRPAHDSETVMRCVYQTKRGGLLPLGGFEETAGYKGYGLALLVDILSGALPGAAYGPHVGDPLDPRPSNIGHFLGAVDVDAFTPVGEFKERVDLMIKEIKASPKAEGQDRIYIHGDKERELEEQRRRTGVPLYFKVWKDLQGIADQLNLESPLK